MDRLLRIVVKSFVILHHLPNGEAYEKQCPVIISEAVQAVAYKCPLFQRLLNSISIAHPLTNKVSDKRLSRFISGQTNLQTQAQTHTN